MHLDTKVRKHQLQTLEIAKLREKEEGKAGERRA
jgi:hypothetical protein